MFKKIFGRNHTKKQELLLAPLSGSIIPIEQVPDPAFAEKMLGDGAAIEPTEGEVVAPLDGEIVSIAPTKHAIGIRSTHGLEILIHIGLETVQMDGEGFETFVKVGDQVITGQRLICFSIDFIQKREASILTPVVITNHERTNSMQIIAQGEVSKGKTEFIKV